MRSFVLWYEPRERIDEKIKLEIHINLWKKRDCIETFVFDFGLLVDKIDLVENIYMYLPFKGSKWSDLGHIVSSDTKLVEGIFNENCEISTFHPKRLKISYKQDAHNEFILYSLSDEDIKKEEYSNGELLILKVGNILNASEKEENQGIDKIKKYYFRFRIEVEKRKTFLIKEIDSNGNLFIDLFSRTETIDFRINDIRSCSEKIMEEFYRNKRFCIRKIHYLLLRNFSDEFIYYDGEVSSRILEKELWRRYIADVPEDAVAYHIKEKTNDEKGIETFSKLVRFRYEKTSWFRIFIIFIVSSIISYTLEKGICFLFTSK